MSAKLTTRHETVTPLNPPIGWIGGKRNLARTLTERIEAIPHTCYAEPFVGMGGVFFRRRQRPRCEIINDASSEVTNLFRLLQRHPEALLKALSNGLSARAEFDRLKSLPPESLTDIERGVRFIALQSMGVGGKVAGRTFGSATTGRANYNVPRIVPVLGRIGRRLAGVHIEQLGFAEFIARYDRPHTLFYCDPPYWGCEGYYGKALFSRADFTRLRDALADIKGRFILSLNDRPEVRELFDGFTIEATRVSYSAAVGRGRGYFGEVIISN